MNLNKRRRQEINSYEVVVWVVNFVSLSLFLILPTFWRSHNFCNLHKSCPFKLLFAFHSKLKEKRRQSDVLARKQKKTKNFKKSLLKVFPPRSCSMFTFQARQDSLRSYDMLPFWELECCFARCYLEQHGNFSIYHCVPCNSHSSLTHSFFPSNLLVDDDGRGEGGKGGKKREQQEIIFATKHDVDGRRNIIIMVTQAYILWLAHVASFLWFHEWPFKWK